eukprot:15165117-Ditylum_brightwellii.AAC.1
MVDEDVNPELVRFVLVILHGEEESGTPTSLKEAFGPRWNIFLAFLLKVIICFAQQSKPLRPTEYFIPSSKWGELLKYNLLASIVRTFIIGGISNYNRV